MRKNPDLVSVLKQLALSIRKEVDDSRSKGAIQPEEELYHRWKVDKFEYTEKGCETAARHIEYITKKSWFRASTKVAGAIKKCDAYLSATKLLTKSFGRENKTAHYLEQFTGRLISRYLEDTEFADADLDVVVGNFLKDIEQEPLRYGAKVELGGIVVLPKTVELKIGDMNVVLRQTTIEDVEKEDRAYWFSMREYLEIPSAILSIEFLARQANEIQTRVEQAIAILRLFKVGSVKYISYRMHSESIADVIASGTVGAGASLAALEKGQISKEDIPKLKKFWQRMTKSLPVGFYEYGDGGLDHRTIAYKRYCDALLQNGVLERRIANAVMGLESLFLKGGETQELTYRLSMRTAKIFALLGQDVYKIKEVVKDAYKVRSLFVHGDHLSYKEKRRLNSKYIDIRNFLRSLLDYLRISIITAIFVRKEKEEFLDIIDDSLVDRDKDSQLTNVLTLARDLVE